MRCACMWSRILRDMSAGCTFSTMTSLKIALHVLRPSQTFRQSPRTCNDCRRLATLWVPYLPSVGLSASSPVLVALQALETPPDVFCLALASLIFNGRLCRRAQLRILVFVESWIPDTIQCCWWNLKEWWSCVSYDARRRSRLRRKLAAIVQQSIYVGAVRVGIGRVYEAWNYC